MRRPLYALGLRLWLIGLSALTTSVRSWTTQKQIVMPGVSTESADALAHVAMRLPKAVKGKLYVKNTELIVDSNNPVHHVTFPHLEMSPHAVFMVIRWPSTTVMTSQSNQPAQASPEP